MKNILYPRLITQTNFEYTKVISYGLIVYSIADDECIIVQRLHSVEFLLILTGQYRPSILSLLIPNITREEIVILENLIDNYDLYKNIFIYQMGYDEKDLEYAYTRFNESKFIILKLINQIVHFNELKWTFPKGRLNSDYYENTFECAKREFIEEVESELPEAKYISSEYIIVESLKTLECKYIETRCWLYIIDKKFELLPTINHSEVNDRKWVSLDTALTLMNLNIHESLNTLIDSFLK